MPTILSSQFVRLPWRRLSLRNLVTSSIEPSLHAPLERPETIVLTESSLYNSSWQEAFELFFPQQGLHFSSINLFKSSVDELPLSAKSLQQTLASDLSHLTTSTGIGAAHTVLIARGPIQSLAGQFFLESHPLAGLVLVDPLLLPDDGRVNKQNATAGHRWKSSMKDFMSLLGGSKPDMYTHHVDKKSHDIVAHPLINTMPTQLSGSKTTQLDVELSLIESMSQKENSQQLLLEPGTVPMLIFYSSANNDCEDYYRICAERTAAFHTCAGSSDYFDQISVAKIPRTNNGEDDLDHLLEQIYEFYDVVVS